MIRRYRSGICTQEEKALLHTWYLSLARDKAAAGQQEFTLTEQEIASAADEISANLPLRKTRIIQLSRLRKLAAAVVILCSFSAGAYLLWFKPPSSRVAGNVYKNDVAPGGNRAILELGDGSEINLNDAELGELTNNFGFSITKTRDDQVTYKVSETSEPAGTRGFAQPQSVYNTVRTPRGGQYQVMLPDGSGAWLNAASSIRFPAIFSGKERRVEITGEVYFEVARKARHSDTGLVIVPFTVIAGKQVVEVLGTRFNINAYSNEGSIRTTLLEGAVKVSSSSADAFRSLKPGEQSLLSADQPIKIQPADLEAATAWKNGQFRYNMEGIEAIMRQVERWYDVEVVYEGSIPEKSFVGTISRDLPLARFLDILSFTGINFRIEGRKIVVLS